MTRPPPVNVYPPQPQQLLVQAPSNPQRGRGGRGRGRGRGRRGRGRGQAGQPGGSGLQLGASSGASISVRDTEVFGVAKAVGQAFQFNPGTTTMKRLVQHEKMYSRYRFKYCNIAYKPLVGTANDSQIYVGVVVGKVEAAMATADKIAMCRPNLILPGWKAGTISLGRFIDSQRFMMSGANDNDGVAFTVLVLGSKDGIGTLTASYDVQFSFPIPF